jgi:hypothetical protein
MRKVYIQKFNRGTEEWIADPENEIYKDGRYFHDAIFYSSMSEFCEIAFKDEIFLENEDETREQSDALVKEFFERNGFKYIENQRMCEIIFTNGNTEYLYGNDATNEAVYEYMAGYDTQWLSIYTIEEALELAKDETELRIRQLLIEDGYMEDFEE